MWSRGRCSTTDHHWGLKVSVTFTFNECLYLLQTRTCKKGAVLPPEGGSQSGQCRKWSHGPLSGRGLAQVGVVTKPVCFVLICGFAAQ